MAVKQNRGVTAPDGSTYVTLTDGAGNIQSPSAGTVVGSTPIVATSGNVAAATATATLTGAVGLTNHLAGFQVTGGGATAGTPFTVTVTGLLGGTITYSHASATGAGLPTMPLIVSFYPPLPASATNTAIAVAATTFGTGNTNASVNAQGYRA